MGNYLMLLLSTRDIVDLDATKFLYLGSLRSTINSASIVQAKGPRGTQRHGPFWVPKVGNSQLRYSRPTVLSPQLTLFMYCLQVQKLSKASLNRSNKSVTSRPSIFVGSIQSTEYWGAFVL